MLRGQIGLFGSIKEANNKERCNNLLVITNMKILALVFAIISLFTSTIGFTTSAFELIGLCNVEEFSIYKSFFIAGIIVSFIFLIFEVLTNVIIIGSIREGKKRTYIIVLAFLFSSILTGIFYLLWQDEHYTSTNDPHVVDSYTTNSDEKEAKKPISEEERIRNEWQEMQLINKYEEMYLDGKITKEEYEKKKEEILNG